MYNVACQKFPNTIVASMFNFKEQTFFEIEEPEQREAVKVKF